MEGLSKKNEKPQDNRSVGRDLKPGRPEYEAGIFEILSDVRRPRLKPSIINRFQVYILISLVRVLSVLFLHDLPFLNPDCSSRNILLSLSTFRSVLSFIKLLK